MLSLRRAVCLLSGLCLFLAFNSSVLSVAQTPQKSLTPAEARKLVLKSRKVPDSAIKEVHRMLAVPPVSVTIAPFLGDQTAILASPQNALVMVRETDCSLTAFNALYTYSAANPNFGDVSRTYHYDQIIHAAAGLTTSAGNFVAGCGDPGVGTLSNVLIYAGITPSNVRVGALVTQATPNLYTIVTKQDGSSAAVTQQPLPTGVGSGYGPVTVVAGDLNNDGIKDLVTVNQMFSAGSFTSTFTVYLGKTDGSFTLGQSYPVPLNFSQSAVLDDFNGDGKLDLVVPSSTPLGVGLTAQVTFYPGNGNGTFGTPVSLTLTSSSPITASIGEGLVSGDFNGDGKKDLISSYGVVLLGMGNGTFTQQGTLSFAAIQSSAIASPALAVGDFNKDSKLDVAAGNGGSIFVFFGNGNGTFTPGPIYASIGNNGYLTATDLDGDGNLDLYSGDATNGIYGGDDYTPNIGYALMGNGDGTFRGAPQALASTVQTLEDLNGDGKLDYVAPIITSGNSYSSSSNLGVFLGNGDGSFKTPAVVTLSPYSYNGTTYTFGGIDSFALADLNGDGHLDLVAIPTGYINTSPSRPGYLVALGNTDGTFQAPAFTPYPSLIPGGGQDYVYQTTGLFAAKRADGKTELVYSFETQDFNGSIPYYEGYATQVVNGDSTLGAPVTTDTYTGPSSVTPPMLYPLTAIADLNGDKIPDVVQYTQNMYASGGVITTPAGFLVYLGNADGSFATGQAVTVVDKPNGPVTIADVNGDGTLDLIAPGQTASDGEIGVALGNGNGTFQTPKKMVLDILPTESPSISVADFDGDGNADMVILGFNPPFDAGVFPGNGDGTFQSTPSSAGDGSVVPLEPIELYAYGSNLVADINGDGKPDIVGGTVLINQYGSVATSPTKTNSTTTLAVSPASITVGQSVTLTATVTGSGATGAVTFANGSTTLGSATLSSSGVATLMISSLTQGSQSITATYGGDGNFSNSTSTAVTVTVTAPKLSSFAFISASPNPATFGQSITLTATVLAGSGSLVPSGMVTFLNHATTTVGTATLNAQGVANLVVNTFPVGLQGISFTYGGDSNFTGSGSGTTTVTVNAATPVNTTTALTASPTTITTGQSVLLTATVAAISGSTVPGGTVTFLNGTTSLGTGTLNGSGVATLNVSTLAVGSQSITANYAATTNFNASASSSVTVTVNAPAPVSTTTALTASPTAITAGQSVTLTATVTAASGSTVPGGTVTFLNGATSLGTGALNGSGVATLSVTTLAVGAQAITASYGGSTSFSGSVSSGVTVTVSAVTPADFSLTLNPANATISSGAQTTSTVTVTPMSSFSGTVSFVCTNFPANVTCGFSPATVAGSGTTTVTISTGVSTAARLHHGSIGSEPVLAELSLGGLLGMLFLRRRPTIRILCFAAFLIGSIVPLSGCGHKATVVGTSSQTPSGTYTMGVLATSGMTSHAANFTLTVK